MDHKVLDQLFVDWFHVGNGSVHQLVQLVIEPGSTSPWSCLDSAIVNINPMLLYCVNFIDNTLIDYLTM